MPKKQIRREMRARRRALTNAQQNVAAGNLSIQLINSPLFNRFDSFALYLPNDGEIRTDKLFERLWRHNKTCALPCLHPVYKNRLWFWQFHRTSKLIRNRFGIPEPDIRKNRHLEIWRLDVVLMPLVAFDLSGNRIGMGGGFYDRTFQDKLGFGRNKPRLIGLAHDFQRVDRLPADSWDIPLHGVITDKAHYTMAASTPA